MLVLEPGADVNDDRARRQRATAGSPAHSRRRRCGRAAKLPRTEGTRKLKRAAIRAWVAAGEQPSGHRRHGHARSARSHGSRAAGTSAARPRSTILA